MPAVPCLPSPCLNNGTCVTGNVTDQLCVCAYPFTGQFCEVQVSTEAAVNLSSLICIYICYQFCSYKFIHLD